MTDFIYDYDDELKRKWDAELRAQGKHNGPCLFNAGSEKERLISNIQSLIAARIEDHPEEFDSDDVPVSRLSRDIRKAELENKQRLAEIWGPGASEKRRREIEQEKKYKALIDLPRKMFADSY